jgi:xanthine dehydrogenase YagR molybdenum-binding subunit
MAEYNWPEASKRSLIGKRINRLDGPVKATGAAKYTYDIKRPGMLYAKIVKCPHAHAKITAIDTSAAERMPGVKLRIIQPVGTEIKWALDEIVMVAAPSEEQAEDAARAVKVDYEVLPHFVTEEQKDKAPETKPAQEQVTGDPVGAMASAAVKAEGYYGLATIAHCCLEAHGQVCEWEGETLTAYCSTQAVSALETQYGEGLQIPASNVVIRSDYMGGGFGSKFSPDRWGIEDAKLAKDAKAPIKLMLDRDSEVAVAGGRPSTYCRVQIGATADGTVTAWSSESWGTGGPAGAGSPPIPYIFEIPNRKHQHISIPTNTGPARAWRAPNHPQAAFITMGAFDDLAAALKMDPLEFFIKNLNLVGATPELQRRAKNYEEELRKAAELIDWKRKWHPRGESGKGPIKSGLGLSLHTWGGRGHRSNCEVLVYPDGSVEVKMGTQDLGTGTRTVIALVAAETFGLPLDAVKVSMGDSRFPESGGSGGSTTVGGVSASTRRASQDALEQLLAKVAPSLGVTPDQLEAVGGKVQVKGDPTKSLPWKQATAKIGATPLSVAGSNPGPGNLIDSGVGGVQMADVSVDVETGVVKINKMVSVQDCGLILDLKTSESQCYGAMIMGIAYALAEERIYDPVTGRILNANMEFYKLAGLGDVGELVVHMMTGPGYDERGVIGLGEPPVISPGAAISNAVANAIGVRVPYLPLTADRVLAALAKKGGAA